jgi:hypothetical protein
MVSLVGHAATTGSPLAAGFWVIWQHTDGSVPTGCDWHPNVADHERMGAILLDELRSRVGW